MKVEIKAASEINGAKFKLVGRKAFLILSLGFNSEFNFSSGRPKLFRLFCFCGLRRVQLNLKVKRIKYFP